jgi:anti-sigma factor RsiW
MADKDYSAELTAFIDGELSEADAQAVQAALASDPALRALETRLRSVITAVEALPEPALAPSPALRRQVLSAIAVPSWRERLVGWFSGPGLVPAGLAVAAAATAVVLWPRRSEEPEGEQLLVASNLELVEDLDLMGLDSPEDLEVIASLHELEVLR